MRLRKRHAWSAVLVALFALPVVKPEGFPGVQGWGDSALSWPARSDIANPHAWLAARAADAAEVDPQVQAIEQILIHEREVWCTERESLAQKASLVDAHQASALDRLPRALTSRILRARDASPRRRSILIDRGTADGVLEGFAVTLGQVFVGTVQRAQPKSARVKCLTDAESRIEVAVRSADGQRAVAFLWGGGDADRLPLRFARPTGSMGSTGSTGSMGSGGSGGRPIQVGDYVVTSNADERVPAGLLVGYVCEVSDPEGDGVPDVRVKPFLDLESYTTATVLLPGA